MYRFRSMARELLERNIENLIGAIPAKIKMPPFGGVDPEAIVFHDPDQQVAVFPDHRIGNRMARKSFPYKCVVRRGHRKLFPGLQVYKCHVDSASPIVPGTPIGRSNEGSITIHFIELYCR